jgi:tripartite-type tricarboxylate transporter receptor subunit TctC
MVLRIMRVEPSMESAVCPAADLGPSHYGAARPRSRGSLVALLMLSLLFFGAIVSGVLVATPQTARAQSTQSAKAFYKGKVLTVIVPFGAAGGYEYWAVALRPFLQKQLGVSQIDIVNRPGGGSVVGDDYLYAAKPDGLTIGEVDGGAIIFDQIMQKPGVSLDMTKFSWLGSPNVETFLSAARSDSAYKSFAQLWKLRGGKKQVVVLSPGYGSTSYIADVVPLQTFKIPYTVLLAYRGSSATKAGLLRGDGDIANFGYSAFRPLIATHKVMPLFLTTPKPSPLLPGVPTVIQLAQEHNLPQSSMTTLEVFAHTMTLGKDWAGPPGLPADRLAFLRAAFRKAVEDPGFAAAVTKVHRVAGYKSPGEIEKTVTNLINDKDEFLSFLKKS